MQHDTGARSARRRARQPGPVKDGPGWLGARSIALADFAELAAAPAVTRVLELHESTVRVGEVQLRRAALGTAALRHAQADVVHQRTGLVLSLGPRREAL